MPARPADRAAWVLRFSPRLLEHVGRSREAGDAATSGARHGGLHERVRRVLAEVVEDDLRRAAPSGGGLAPPALLARHVADTFLLVLDWWVECGAQRSAADIDRLFRSLVLPAVAAAVATAAAPAEAR